MAVYFTSNQLKNTINKEFDIILGNFTQQHAKARECLPTKARSGESWMVDKHGAMRIIVWGF